MPIEVFRRFVDQSIDVLMPSTTADGFQLRHLLRTFPGVYTTSGTLVHPT